MLVYRVVSSIKEFELSLQEEGTTTFCGSTSQESLPFEGEMVALELAGEEIPGGYGFLARFTGEAVFSFAEGDPTGDTQSSDWVEFTAHAVNSCWPVSSSTSSAEEVDILEEEDEEWARWAREQGFDPALLQGV